MVLMLLFLSRYGFRTAVPNGAVKRKWSRIPSPRRLLTKATPRSTAIHPQGCRASVPTCQLIPGLQRRRSLTGRRSSPWRLEERPIRPLLSPSLLLHFSHSKINKLLCCIRIVNKKRENFLFYRSVQCQALS